MKLLLLLAAIISAVVLTETVSVARCGRLARKALRLALDEPEFDSSGCPARRARRNLDRWCAGRNGCDKDSVSKCRRRVRETARNVLRRIGCSAEDTTTSLAPTTPPVTVSTPPVESTPPVTVSTPPVESTAPVVVSPKPEQCTLSIKYRAFTGHGPWRFNIAGLPSGIDVTEFVEVDEVGIGTFENQVSTGDSIEFSVRDIQFAESFPNDQFQGKYELLLNGTSFASGNVDAVEFLNFTVADNACEVVAPAAPGPFKIDFIFDRDTIDPAFDVIFRTAAARWENVIQKSSGPKFFEVLGERTMAQDLLVEASFESVGNPDIIALGGPTGFKSELDGWRPFFGFIVVSQPSLDLMDSLAIDTNDTLLQVITHELGHVLGVGDLWDNFRDDLRNPGEDNLEYIGANGVMQLESYSMENEEFVPLSNSTGASTFLTHWREEALDTELMTGLIDPGKLPLSRITIGFLEDIGYDVNYQNADPYTLPVSVEAVRAEFEELVDDGFRLLGSTLVKPQQRAFLLDAVDAPASVEEFEEIVDDAILSESGFASRRKTKKVPRG